MGGVAGVVTAVVGGGLLLRSATNRRFRELAGLDGRRSLIPFNRTFHVDAPVGDVFELWPRLRAVSALHGARAGGGAPRRGSPALDRRRPGRTAGDLGGDGHRDDLQRVLSNECLAWESVAGSQVPEAASRRGWPSAGRECRMGA
jgi:uncharacterized membrane protein